MFCKLFQLPDEKGIAILALSDIGLCPRMQNHAIAAAHYFPKRKIYIIGYFYSSCHINLTSNPQIKLYPISGIEYLENFKRKTRNILFPVYAIIKIIVQFILTLWTLLTLPPVKTLLVQNPPTIPTLMIAWLACRLKGAKFVIDWHNYGYSLLEITLHSIKPLKYTPIIFIAKLFEKFFGQIADHGLCVSENMKLHLNKQWSIQARVLYDRPSDSITPINLLSKHRVLQKHFGYNKNSLFNELENYFTNTDDIKNTQLKLSEQYIISSKSESFKIPSIIEDKINATKEFVYESNSITELTINKVSNDYIFTLKNKCLRPAIILTSTSWTPDENLNFLLEALKLYNSEYSGKMQGKLPELFVIITGKNPDINWFKAFNSMKLDCIRATSLFAPMEDYYKLLASADLGISLHTSSSGLDLPMKIVDMQGAGLPVLAYYFETIHEQISIDNNAKLFTNSQSLKNELITLLQDFPTSFDKLVSNENSTPTNTLYTMRKFCENNRPVNFDYKWSQIAKEIKF